MTALRTPFDVAATQVILTRRYGTVRTVTFFLVAKHPALGHMML